MSNKTWPWPHWAVSIDKDDNGNLLFCSEMSYDLTIELSGDVEYCQLPIPESARLPIERDLAGLPPLMYCKLAMRQNPERFAKASIEVLTGLNGLLSAVILLVYTVFEIDPYWLWVGWAITVYANYLTVGVLVNYLLDADS